MDFASRNVLEKLYLAHAMAEASWDGTKHRVYAEDPVGYLIADEDHETLAWRMYHHLYGRCPDFFQWIEEQLGVTAVNRDATIAMLWDRYQTPRLAKFVEMQRDLNRIGAEFPATAAGPQGGQGDGTL